MDNLLPAILTGLFCHIAGSQCEAAILRPRFPEQEDIYEGDFDLVLNPAHVDLFITQAWRFLTSHEADFYIDRQRQEKIRIEIIDPSNRRKITLELWLALQIRKAPGYAPFIFWCDLAPFIEKAPKSLTGYELRPDIELCYYLSHLQTKKKRLDTPLVKKRLTHYAAIPDLPTTLRPLLASAPEQERLSDIAKTANAYLCSIGILKTAGISMPLLRHLMLDLCFRFNLARSRNSQFVTFLGPDGVGKTTLIQHFLSAEKSKSYYFKFKNSYRKSLFYKPLQWLTRQYYRHRFGKNLAKNQIDERTALILLLLAAFKIRLRGLLDRIRGRLAMADRGFSDFYIQGTRFTCQPMQLNYSTLRLHWITPPARAIIHLYAPPTIIAARKQELDITQITAYQELTLKTYLLRPSIPYAAVSTHRSTAESLATLQGLAHVIK